MFGSRIANQSIARQFIRYSSKKKAVRGPNRIQVQLLKDSQFGTKGEVLSISPGFMRNVLHHFGVACYMNEGPRIPVVETRKVSAQEAKERRKQAQETAAADEKVSAATTKTTQAEALTLDELSSLFNTLKKRPSKSNSPAFVFEKEVTVSSEEIVESERLAFGDLVELMPDLHVVNSEKTKLPLEESFFKNLYSHFTGGQLTENDFKLYKNSKQIKSITEPGAYEWRVYAADGQFTKSRLVVE
ncbi:uncharacterized protein KQ657_001565 [Scheffersomyces spartinae]|uniref:Ribosomal protein L9 domain-containing protein n=1 Tax=Scheffersomyces spartinae TaxID=45513 RepID=A0A9P7V7U1_9ASCO|nr:uncharacterized protein KQ657_001565 [Scheffersomyces spartinae]KAG7192782.1 hypothetical protein KQ657_001565 [Scheffersomyces spartinae]